MSDYYDSQGEVLSDIYGSEFLRVNWMNNKTFRNVKDVINYIADEKDNGSKFLVQYDKYGWVKVEGGD